MLRVASFSGIATTAVERGGNGFEIDRYGDGKEGRLGRSCRTDKNWEATGLQRRWDGVTHFIDYGDNQLVTQQPLEKVQLTAHGSVAVGRQLPFVLEQPYSLVPI
jgi:hypothetical protein